MKTQREARSNDHLRFHLPTVHLNSAFGNNWFARKAESFARFFGTPFFLIGQTAIVLIWILLNTLGFYSFDLYPFILLNLAFSLQAAYAAPLILLAQTRQSDRDKAHAEADAKHREEIADETRVLLEHSATQTEQILELLRLNTKLTEVTHDLSQKIEQLTKDIHKYIVK